MTTTIVRILGSVALSIVLMSAACSATSSDGGLFGPDRADAASPARADAEPDEGATEAPDAGTEKTTDAAGPDAGGKACASRKGIYQLTQSYLTGNCGTAQFVSNFNYASCAQAFCLPYAAEAAGETDMSRVFAGCVGSVTPSADGCRTEYDYTCTSAGGGKLKYVGVTAWDALGNSGADATQTYSTFTAAGVATCTGQYQVAIRRP